MHAPRRVILRRQVDPRYFKCLGDPKAAVEYDQMDLINFISKNFGPLNAMMERAGMSEMDI